MVPLWLFWEAVILNKNLHIYLKIHYAIIDENIETRTTTWKTVETRMLGLTTEIIYYFLRASSMLRQDSQRTGS